MDKWKGSFFYRLLKKSGFELPPEYYDISFWEIIGHFIKDYRNNFLGQLSKRSYLFGNTLSLHWIRQFYHRRRGIKIGKNTRIAEDCILGFTRPELITIEDDVAIAAKCMLLEHKRDISLFRKGDSLMNCNYVVAPIVLKKGCFLGIGSTVMPGVEVGQGAIIAPGSVVEKSVRPYVIVRGNPAKEILEFPEKRNSPNDK